MTAGRTWAVCATAAVALVFVPWAAWPPILLVGAPVAWATAMVVREWVHGRQHQRRIETHDAAIEAALLGERSLLETRLSGVMSDALRAAMGDDYPETSPIHDDIATSVFDAELRSIEGPGDLGWGSR